MNDIKPYHKYNKILGNQTYPIAILDKTLLNKNTETNLNRSQNKIIRIASKSVRCVNILKAVLSSNNQYQGIMAYHGLEAVALSKEGFDDILMGYPIVDEYTLTQITLEVKKGKQICLMVDLPEHITIANNIANKHDVTLPICIDIDMSKQFTGIYFGVWRSSIKQEKDLINLLEIIKKQSNIKLSGLMGYEAQIAGVNDANKGDFLMNKVIGFLKRKSIKEFVEWRKKAVNIIKENGFKLEFVNGGGTGSLETTSTEDCVTEVTVGSGFYCSHLFDNYSNFKLNPALFYSVQIVRQPSKNIYTCHGGGFIASGTTDKTKAPKVYLPEGLELIPNEGAGEVQTPLKVPKSVALKIGDPVYFRHAKAGELLERFNKIIVINEDETLDEYLTYRGMGWCFG